MKIRSNTRIEIGRLFASLEFGERIAHDCATRQAELSNGSHGRFFERQARQESHHARVFGRVILCIAPRGPRPVPLALRDYRTRLNHAGRRGDMVDLLVGQQLVLEGLGELILHRLDRKFDQRHIGFKRLRKVLLAQERGHQAFGERTVQRLVESGEARPERIRELTGEYLVLAQRVLGEMQSVFDVVDADAAWYGAALRERLEHWLDLPT